MRRPRRHPMAMRRANPADPCRAPARTCRHTPAARSTTRRATRCCTRHHAASLIPPLCPMPTLTPGWRSLPPRLRAGHSSHQQRSRPAMHAREGRACRPSATHAMASPARSPTRCSSPARCQPSLTFDWHPLPPPLSWALSHALLDGPRSDALDAREARAGRLTPLATRRSPRAYLRPVAKDSQGLRSDASRSDACPSDAPRPSPRRHLAHRARAAHRRLSLLCRRSKRGLSPWPWARHVLPHVTARVALMSGLPPRAARWWLQAGGIPLCARAASPRSGLSPLILIVVCAAGRATVCES